MLAFSISLDRVIINVLNSSSVMVAITAYLAFYWAFLAKCWHQLFTTLVCYDVTGLYSGLWLFVHNMLFMFSLF